MADEEISVASEIPSEEQSADDARTAEITAETLIADLNGGPAITADESSGDSAPREPDSRKRDNQMRAALAQQRKTIFEQLGMPEAEVRELILSHKAEQMAKDDPDISPKAARRILDAQNRPDERLSAYAEDIRTLMADGWSSDELMELSRDGQVQADLASGKSVRQAATAFLRRTSKAQAQPSKRGVPTVRSTSTEGTRDPNDIASMSDEEFDRFSKRIEEEALKGRKVRI